MKNQLWFVLGIIAGVVLIVTYTRLSEVQKRKLVYMARQIPYLPARYLV